MYDSRFGNTEAVARAIVDGLAEHCSARAVPAAEADLTHAAPDLLVVGGPTQRRHLSSGLRSLLDGLPHRSVPGVRAATFDTRYRMARSLSGSAAREAAPRLKRAGCRLVAPPESFFMPNFLVTGMLAIVLAAAVFLWAAAFIQRKRGGAVLLLLTVVLFLAGAASRPYGSGSWQGSPGPRSVRPSPGGEHMCLRGCRGRWPLSGPGS